MQCLLTKDLMLQKKKNHFSQPVSVSHTVKHEQQFKNMSGNTSPPAD